MDRVVQSSSSSKGAAFAAMASLLMAGCAASAPALPPDTTSVNRGQTISLQDFSPEDRALSCEQIAAERRQISDAKQGANSRIEANRARNQVAGFIGSAVFLPAYIATEGNYREKEEVAKLYARQDTLIKLAGVKHCPSEPIDRSPSGTD